MYSLGNETDTNVRNPLPTDDENEWEIETQSAAIRRYQLGLGLMMTPRAAQKVIFADYAMLKVQEV